MSFNLQISQEDWERIQRDWTAGWHQDIDRPATIINAYEGQEGNLIPRFSGWKANLLGAGVVAACCGVRVGVDENTIWFEPAWNQEVDNLQLKLEGNNFGYRWHPGRGYRF
jgi:hypothetical protein